MARLSRMTASATSTGAFRLSFLIARFSSTEESSLRQLLAQRAAGVQRGVIRRFAAGHALAHKADAGIIAVLFPAAHPLAVAPAVGAEQRGALAAKAAQSPVPILPVRYMKNIRANS